MSYGDLVKSTNSLVAYFPLQNGFSDDNGANAELVADGNSDAVFSIGGALRQGAVASCSADDVSKTAYLFYDSRTYSKSISCVEVWYKPITMENALSYYMDIFSMDMGFSTRHLLITLTGQSGGSYFHLIDHQLTEVMSSELTIQKLFDHEGGNHCIFQDEDGKTNFYLNGILVYTYNSESITARSIYGILAGPNGLASDFALYSAPLSSDEIAERNKYQLSANPVNDVYKSLSESILSTDGLLGYYKLDTQEDSSGLHNQGGTIVGAGFGEFDVLTGIAGSTQEHHDSPEAGDASYVAVPYGCLSFELRAKPYLLQVDETHTIPFASRSSVNSDNDGFRLVSYPYDDPIDYDSRKGSDTQDVLDADNKWHHFVIQEETPGSISCYIDGELAVVDSATSFADLVYLLLGCSSTSVGYYGGGTTNNNVAFYNRPLTQQEIDWRVYQNEPIGDIDFVPLGTIPSSLVYYPKDAILSTTVGTGLLNKNGSSVYLISGASIDKGETRSIINEDLSAVSALTFGEDGVISLVEDGGTSHGYSDAETLGFSEKNGQLAISGDGENVLFSVGFGYNFFKIAIALADGETLDTLKYSGYQSAGDVDFTHYYFSHVIPTWAHQLIREQANPQPEQIQQGLKNKFDIKLVGKAGNHSSLLDRNGELRSTGYIESTVTINKIPTANRKVMCFTNDGQLVDEKISNKEGVYRFDHLFMTDKYMIVAQYSHSSKSAPDYTAVAADWQTPTAY